MHLHAWISGLAAAQLLCLATPSSVLAQADSGARIRVTTKTGQERKSWGSLVSLGPDSLRFISSRTRRVVSIPTAAVERLDRSYDRRSNAGGGALIGAGIGAATGLVLGILASQEDDSFYEVGTGDVFAAMLVLGAVGAGVGALIGAASHKERWEPVPLPGQPGTEARKPDGTRVGLVLRF